MEAPAGSGYGATTVFENPEDIMADSAVPPVEATRVDPRLLELLVCPLTKESLEYDAAREELISRSAKLAYPIRDGIPIMLPEEARSLSD